MAEDPSDRAIQRLKDEMERKNLNQTDVAALLGWEPSRVSKILTRKIELKVDDLALLCFALNLSLVEVVRDHGLEFCAEMRPAELRILERLRQLPPHVFEALITLLSVRATTRLEPRSATKKKPIFGRPRNPVDG